MKRLRVEKIDDPEFYERVWEKEWEVQESRGDVVFDRIRMRGYLNPTIREEWRTNPKRVYHLCDLGAGVYGLGHWLALGPDPKWESRDRWVITNFDQSLKAEEIYWRTNPSKVDSHRYLIGKAEDTGLPSDSFDLVTAGELIEHYVEPAQLVKEMYRLCKPGGWIVISTVDPKCDDAIRRGLVYPEHIWEFTMEDLLGLFGWTGEVVYYRVGNYHFIRSQKV